MWVYESRLPVIAGFHPLPPLPVTQYCNAVTNFVKISAVLLFENGRLNGILQLFGRENFVPGVPDVPWIGAASNVPGFASSFSYVLYGYTKSC